MTGTTAAAEFAAGVYDLMPEDEYHADPVPGGSLSSTGARRLLPPGCPALFRYEQQHPVFKGYFDYGSAAHKMVLGTGPKIEIVDAGDWRTDKAKDARDAARAAGFVPLLAHEHAQVEAMAAAIQDHPVAGALFDPLSGGRAERSVFWYDREFGVWCRCRPDWLAGQRTGSGRLIVVDYKTAEHADLDSIPKSVARYGYHQQHAWYVDGVRAVGLDDDPAFIFAFQEKRPPYLVTVVQLPFEDEQIGRERNRIALERYRDCRAAGDWPGYSDEIELVTLPPWGRSRGDDLK